MILLTKLDGSIVLISVDAVKYIEKTPDSLITFLNGDTLFVKESIEEIQKIVIKYKRETLDKN